MKNVPHEKEVIKSGKLYNIVRSRLNALIASKKYFKALSPNVYDFFGR